MRKSYERARTRLVSSTSELLIRQAASLTERDSRLAHYLRYLRVLGYLWAIYLLPVQNMTSTSSRRPRFSVKTTKFRANLA